MSCLTDNAILSAWLIQYGGLVLFGLLALGILALPVPEESLMVLAGIFISREILDLSSTLIAAYAGSMCGISMSYLVGSTGGRYLLDKYGHQGWIAGPISKAQSWFQRFGKWALLVGYFIPGVRHFTGFLSGMVGMPFREFALFAYSGAILWVSFFISLGYFLESYCFGVIQEWDVDTGATIAVVTSVLVIYWVCTRVKSSMFK